MCFRDDYGRLCVMLGGLASRPLFIIGGLRPYHDGRAFVGFEEAGISGLCAAWVGWGWFYVSWWKRLKHLPLYVPRVMLYSWLTGWTCWEPGGNAYWRRCIRFWTAKLLGLHHDWRADGTEIPKWKPHRI
jgi:hypothetical protein